ncbi:MAG: hypothetical protein B7Z41_08405, partial [Rhizobiales bacterium 12-66-7]
MRSPAPAPASSPCRPPICARSTAQLRAYNAYGPTEFSVCATVHRVRAEDAQGARLPIGRPLPNTSLHILDENLEPAPIGVPGEIYLGGLGLARGYQGDEGRTERAFITHPRSGARLYRTGDFGAWRADGSVDCLGRLDDQVKVAGHRVELGEVEAALRQVEGLRDVHVTRLERDDGSVALAAYYCAEEKVELWPSVAEFFVYDDVAYGAMAADEGRNARYRDAFARHLPGKSVVDIGTGPLAILARLAVETGARKVYAVDRLEATARKARETVEKLGLSDRIEVIHGDAMTVHLPEKVDACISEIVGAIGGAEGSAKIINGARHLLADPAAMYPMFSDTRIAALSLPADQLASGFSDIAGHYVEKIFAEVGHPFDLRLCLKNCPREAIVSDDAPFEYLDYTNDAALEADEDVALTIARDCAVTGFLVWLRLGVDERSVVDILDNPGSWLPVYLPVFDQPVAVKAGDVIALHISRRLCANGLNPDFILDGAVRRTLGEEVPFSYFSAHFGDGFRRTPFYARLFADGQVPRQEVPTPAVLRQHLLKSVPAYAVPAFFVKLDQMPVTLNGKVDKTALPLPALRAPAAQASAPATPLEADILAIWQAVMGREAIGTGDDFFSLGGDSIRAIQIVSRLRQAGWKAEIRDVFQNPTVKDLARVVKPLRVAADQGPVTGAVPLTPIQHWFLETAEAPHHFNQSVLLRAPRIHGDAARAALSALWTQHDALRAAFGGAEGRAQVFNAPERPPTLAEIDLPAEAEADAHAFEVAADALQAGFALDETPLLAALLAHGADGDRLLLVAHHLVVDAVSWSILLEDFETAYQAARAGAHPRLPQKTASYRDHALALEKIRAKVDWAHRLNFWRALEEEPALLPEWSGPARLCDMVRAEGHLDAEETTRLLEGANGAYTTNVQDLLLAALALALEQQFGRRSALVSVEGHGRDYPFADLFGEDLPDVSRTVGWFTVFHPLKVHVGGDLASTIRGVKESARRTPDQGWSYPLLRQFAGDVGLAILKPQVGFNYLGVLSGGGRAGAFTIDWNTPGQALAPQTLRPHAIEILTAVEDGKLSVNLEMDGGAFSAADAQALSAVRRQLRPTSPMATSAWTISTACCWRNEGNAPAVSTAGAGKRGCGKAGHEGSAAVPEGSGGGGRALPDPRGPIRPVQCRHPRHHQSRRQPCAGQGRQSRQSAAVRHHHPGVRLHPAQPDGGSVPPGGAIGGPHARAPDRPRAPRRIPRTGGCGPGGNLFLPHARNPDSLAGRAQSGDRHPERDPGDFHHDLHGVPVVDRVHPLGRLHHHRGAGTHLAQHPGEGGAARILRTGKPPDRKHERHAGGLQGSEDERCAGPCHRPAHRGDLAPGDASAHPHADHLCHRLRFLAGHLLPAHRRDGLRRPRGERGLYAGGGDDHHGEPVHDRAGVERGGLHSHLHQCQFRRREHHAASGAARAHQRAQEWRGLQPGRFQDHRARRGELRPCSGGRRPAVHG